MKIAIATDDLIQYGGQERLVSVVSEIWPDAPIFTTQVSDFWQDFYNKRNVEINTSFMQKIPFGRNINRYLFPFLFHSIAFETFDFSQYDVVLSISSRFAHFVNTKASTLHVAYINSPGRMFWEPLDYFENENFGGNSTLKTFSNFVLSPFLFYTRMADYAAAQRIDHIISNSKNIRNKVSRYYSRNSEVIYPFIDIESYANKIKKSTNEKNYFVLITRLVAWKKVDIAIRACNELNYNLKIISTGPDLDRLQKIAGPTIEFLGKVTEEKKWEVLSDAKALIQTQREDFGIVPLEAMLSGIPVIGFGKGGVLETVIPGKTGEFYFEQTPTGLINALIDFNHLKYNSVDCIDQAKKFDVKLFKKELYKTIEERTKPL